jgi:GDP/UDP-N,N'-diacetylbacillosamine 2-epimerase (hydrolysing)
MRHVVVVTSSRAEYGLLRSLIENLSSSSDVKLSLVVSGTHLSEKHGATASEILGDGFRITQSVDIGVDSTNSLSIANSIAKGVEGFTGMLSDLKPDIVVVLGDRYEILSVAIACLISRVPLAHIHGGETTQGAFDEAIRHSITKMAHLHFVAAEEYGKRVIQLGEDPKRVFVVGGLGVDAILNCDLMDEGSLQTSLGVKFKEKRILVTYHPETLSEISGIAQIEVLIDALSSLDECTVIFTGANADPSGEAISDRIKAFCRNRVDFHFFESLGQKRYLSCLSNFDVVVGNSSSGLLEAPTFGIRTINIGNRQRGRLQATSVTDCKLDPAAIRSCLEQALNATSEGRRLVVDNPYGSGGASKKICEKIRSVNLDNILVKAFHNL